MSRLPNTRAERESERYGGPLRCAVRLGLCLLVLGCGQRVVRPEKVVVWNAEFRVVKNLTRPADLATFAQMFQSKVVASATEKVSWSHKVDIIEGRALEPLVVRPSRLSSHTCEGGDAGLQRAGSR